MSARTGHFPEAGGLSCRRKQWRTGMWKRSEVDPSKKYQVALCASPSGSRSHALHPLEHGVPRRTRFF